MEGLGKPGGAGLGGTPDVPTKLCGRVLAHGNHPLAKGRGRDRRRSGSEEYLTRCAAVKMAEEDRDERPSAQAIENSS